MKPNSSMHLKYIYAGMCYLRYYKVVKHFQIFKTISEGHVNSKAKYSKRQSKVPLRINVEVVNVTGTTDEPAIKLLK